MICKNDEVIASKEKRNDKDSRKVSRKENRGIFKCSYAIKKERWINNVRTEEHKWIPDVQGEAD